MTSNLDLRFSATFGRHVLLGIPYVERVAERQFGRRALGPSADDRLVAEGLRPRIPRRRVDAGVLVIPIIPAEGIVTSGATFSYRVRVDDYQTILHFAL